MWFDLYCSLLLSTAYCHLSRSHTHTHRDRKETVDAARVCVASFSYRHSLHVACPTFAVCLKLVFVDAAALRRLSQTSPIITYQRRPDDGLAPAPPRNYLFIHSRHQTDQAMDSTAGWTGRHAYRTTDVTPIAGEADLCRPRPPVWWRPADCSSRSTAVNATRAVVDDEIICPMAAKLTERNGHGG